MVIAPRRNRTYEQTLRLTGMNMMDDVTLIRTFDQARKHGGLAGLGALDAFKRSRVSRKIAIGADREDDDRSILNGG